MPTKEFIFVSHFYFTLIFFMIFLTLYFIITARNPVVVVLFLIFFFFLVGSIFIYCGADYLGALFILLYAGAISIIFLFVVMFIDLKELYLRKETYSGSSICILFIVFFLFFFDLLIQFYFSLVYYIPRLEYDDWLEHFFAKSNIEAVGLALYTSHLFEFIVLGVFLFLIMVMIISLLVNFNTISKRQILHQQLKNHPLLNKLS